ncbi:MAG: hypothetical protein AB9891_15460 [Anaerolineaceae bacterium]
MTIAQTITGMAGEALASVQLSFPRASGRIKTGRLFHRTESLSFGLK